MNRNTKLIAAGLATLATVGASFFYLRETRHDRIRYDSLKKSGAFELRAYPALLVAETVQTGDRERATNRGFRILASYIFAEEREGDTIAMTAPVLTEPTSDGLDGWKTRFIMPSQWTEATLPPPGREVEFNDIPARKVAAIRFSGQADDTLFTDKESELYRWINDNGLKPIGEAEYAFYNSPIVPGPLRRNEVLIEVA